jgi:hypothetical protein
MRRIVAPSLALAPAFALLLASCVSMPADSPTASGDGSGGEGGSLGIFEVSGDTGPSARLVPTRCGSGDPELFLGVDLEDERQGLVVRVVFDALDGPVLRVFDRIDPHVRTVLFFPEECDVFDVSIEPTGWKVNDVRVFRAALDVDCVTEDGARLAGHAEADSCR